MEIKLATWNIHRCVGTDGVMSPQRCAEVLRAINADIIALQEVEFQPHSERNVLAYLARETCCRAIAGMTMVREGVHYGNAVLTRLPVRDVRRHNLSVQEREPRAALDVDLESDHCQLQFIATHLGLRPIERREQVERLLHLFRIQDRDLVMLAGDLNEWFLWGRPLSMLQKIFPSIPYRRTWPTFAPVFALDRIWVHPPQVLRDLAVHRSATARVASDHLPLMAMVDLKLEGVREKRRC